MKNKIIFFILLFVFCLKAQVTIKDTVISWHTFKYTLNNDYTVNWCTNLFFDTVSIKFNAYVLENEFLKVTLVPEFGGRIISIIYKPTGHEQLYCNPVGAPYGIGKGWFYYNWLMVYGGIFPTLPEPEHGKAWLLPWEFRIIKNTTDSVSCKMSWQDTIQLERIDLNKWKYGKTNLKCDFIVTLVTQKSSLDVDVILYNESNKSLDYEYWTCLTLAPGSNPQNPECSAETEMIIPVALIKIPSWYPDIARQEKPVSGRKGIYYFDKLRLWKNWINDGIAYPWEDTNENFWGVINHTNNEGIIRVADNSITPGIKIWAWSFNQRQNINPFLDPTQVHRPYVELWAGQSNEFFEPAHFNPNSFKKWKEIYIPTVGLSNVRSADYNVVTDLNFKPTYENKIVSLNFVTAYPKSDINVRLEITGQNSFMLYNQKIMQDPIAGNKIVVKLPENYFYSNNDSIRYTISDLKNGYSFTDSYQISNIITNISEHENSITKNFILYQNYPNPFNSSTVLKWYLPFRSYVTLKLYNSIGEEIKVLVNGTQEQGIHTYLLNGEQFGLSSGVYFITFLAENNIKTKKIIYMK
ncbi:MAG: DUF5107 domain-containing protein [Thermoplasmata archaeon]